MGKYLIRRLLQVIPVLCIISFVVFCLVFVAGDPVGPCQRIPDQEDIEQLSRITRFK
ncbi:hypothetical protein [Ureibacillus acetophenoni]